MNVKEKITIDGEPYHKLGNFVFTLTNAEELLFQAGQYAGRAEICLRERTGYASWSDEWTRLTREAEKWKAKSERYMKRAQKAAIFELHCVLNMKTPENYSTVYKYLNACHKANAIL